MLWFGYYLSGFYNNNSLFLHNFKRYLITFRFPSDYLYTQRFWDSLT